MGNVIEQPQNKKTLKKKQGVIDRIPSSKIIETYKKHGTLAKTASALGVSMDGLKANIAKRDDLDALQMRQDFVAENKKDLVEAEKLRQEMIGIAEYQWGDGFNKLRELNDRHIKYLRSKYKDDKEKMWQLDYTIAMLDRKANIDLQNRFATEHLKDELRRGRDSNR